MGIEYRAEAMLFVDVKVGGNTLTGEARMRGLFGAYVLLPA